MQFRNELRQVVERKNRERLLEMVADDVLVSFGGYYGKKDFVSFWKLDSSGPSELWHELGEALRYGCAVEGDARAIPSFGKQVGGDRDVFDTLIASPESSLRARADEGSPAVARLNWDVLTVSLPWHGGEWVAVTLDDGRSGFVRRSQVRSPIDYRASFQKRRGRWVMGSFVAGD